MAPKPLACWICGKQVDLTNCKVDEHGLPVHEPCYVAKMVVKSRPDSQVKPEPSTKNNSPGEGHEPAA